MTAPSGGADQSDVDGSDADQSGTGPGPAAEGDRPAVAVIDYGIGNLRSAEKALQRVGAHASLTHDPGRIRSAAGVVLPGVGAFGRCMEALRDRGLDTVVLERIESGQPFLGICVGMQMLYEGSEESAGVPGLGVLPGRVVALPKGVKRPQMQWNTLTVTRPAAMLDGLGDDRWWYFVHSFAPLVNEVTVATCDYGGTVCAAAEQGSLWATQFHPEKSGSAGLALLTNFVAASRAAAAA